MDFLPNQCVILLKFCYILSVQNIKMALFSMHNQQKKEDLCNYSNINAQFVL